MSTSAFRRAGRFATRKLFTDWRDAYVQRIAELSIEELQEKERKRRRIFSASGVTMAWAIKTLIVGVVAHGAVITSTAGAGLMIVPAFYIFKIAKSAVKQYYLRKELKRRGVKPLPMTKWDFGIPMLAAGLGCLGGSALSEAFISPEAIKNVTDELADTARQFCEDAGNNVAVATENAVFSAAQVQGMSNLVAGAAGAFITQEAFLRLGDTVLKHIDQTRPFTISKDGYIIQDPKPEEDEWEQWPEEEWEELPPEWAEEDPFDAYMLSLAVADSLQDDDDLCWSDDSIDDFLEAIGVTDEASFDKLFGTAELPQQPPQREAPTIPGYQSPPNSPYSPSSPFHHRSSFASSGYQPSEPPTPQYRPPPYLETWLRPITTAHNEAQPESPRSEAGSYAEQMYAHYISQTSHAAHFQPANHAHQRPASPALSHATSMDNEDHAAIYHLVSMGFPREQALVAFRNAEYSLEGATELLLSGLTSH